MELPNNVARTSQVLLLDENEEYYNRLSEFLDQIQNSEYQLKHTRKVEEAIRELNDRNYDFVLVDFAENGIEDLQKIIDFGVNIPLIVLVDHEDEDAESDALEAGATDYLIKGQINTQVFERTIRYARQRFRNKINFHEQNQRLRALFHKSPLAVFVINDKGELIDSNGAFSDMFNSTGISRQSTTSFRTFFNSQEDYDRFLTEIKSKKVSVDYESRMLTNENKIIHVLISTSSIEGLEGEFLMYQGVVHDITLRKKVEREQLLHEKLRLTTKMKRALAHEIRNPLTNIHLAIEQLKDELEEDEFTIYTDIVERNTNRINDLISELLDAPKISELQKVGVHLNDVLDEALFFCNDRLNLTNITVRKHYADDLPSIALDVEKIKIAWINIITNAIEAMTAADDPLLRIHTGSNGQEVFVEIHDNGIGMSDDQKERLFEPYFSNKEDGLGIGMTATLTIIQQHQGEIAVVSEVGSGTCFRISFSL